MTDDTPEKQTEKWYRDYYSRKGQDRNNALTNPGVLFQLLALQQSVTRALRSLPITDTWSILDVGCGSGESLLLLLSLGIDPRQLHGLDLLRNRIKRGKQRHPNLQLVCGDACHMGYRSESFDMVMESTMFIQLNDHTASMAIAREMLRIVKCAGYIVLIDWRYSFRHPEYTAMSRRRINQLFGVGSVTKLHTRTSGALVPPVGRFLSANAPSFYFLIQTAMPFLVGQVVTVLQKVAAPTK